MDVAKFDRRLCEMKLLGPTLLTQSATRSVWRRVGYQRRKLGQSEGIGFYVKLVDSALSVLREYLKEVDRICRDVWQAQGGTVTSEFVCTVVRDAVLAAIAARCGAIRGEIELMSGRKRFKQLTPVLDHLARERKHLESIMSNRYELEANELDHKHAQNGPTAVVPAATGSDPGETMKVKEREKPNPPSRAVTNAPEPITSVSGTGGWRRPRPKPTQIPPNLPGYYPTDLKPQTQLIIAEGVRLYPSRPMH